MKQDLKCVLINFGNVIKLNSLSHSLARKCANYQSQKTYMAMVVRHVLPNNVSCQKANISPSKENRVLPLNWNACLVINLSLFDCRLLS